MFLFSISGLTFKRVQKLIALLRGVQIGKSTLLEIEDTVTFIPETESTSFILIYCHKPNSD